MVAVLEEVAMVQRAAQVLEVQEVPQVVEARTLMEQQEATVAEEMVELVVLEQDLLVEMVVGRKVRLERFTVVAVLEEAILMEVLVLLVVS